jgi:hypothetical protein
MAHDMVATAHPVSMDGDPASHMGNTRQLPLRLETLYGGGPFVTPHLYQNETSDKPRLFFRLGKMSDIQEAPQEALCQGALRDIARMVTPLTDPVFCPYKASNIPDMREPLLADVRNDNNGIVSQLSTVFMLLHNAIMRNLMEAIEHKKPSGTDGLLFAKEPWDTLSEQSIDLFTAVRAVVSVLYRRIVVRDVLPRILHPGVLSLYKASGTVLLDKAALVDRRPVLEFAFAGFRFAHAMIRNSYQFRAGESHTPFDIQKVLQQSSSALSPTKIPPDERWIVQWRQFFDCGGTPQYSRRIGPFSTLAHSYGASLLGPIDQGTKDPAHALGSEGETGLDYRDLVSSGLVRLWTLPTLVEAMSREAQLPALHDLINTSALLSDPAQRAGELRAWFSAHASGTAGDAAKLETLVVEPPLSFFLRFEAASTLSGGGEGGKHLGVLGSLLVAEPVFAALKTSAPAYEDDTAPTQTLVRKIIARYLGNIQLPEIGNGPWDTSIETMPALLTAIVALNGAHGFSGPDFI